MPRTAQTRDKSRKTLGKDKAAKGGRVQKAAPRPQPKSKEMTNDEVQTLLRRVQRREKRAQTIRALCGCRSVLPGHPLIRLTREATKNAVGENVHLQASAMVSIRNSVESLIVELLEAASEHIPHGRQTLNASHIHRALKAPHFKEAFRIVDGRMKLRPRAVKKKSS